MVQVIIDPYHLQSSQVVFFVSRTLHEAFIIVIHHTVTKDATVTADYAALNLQKNNVCFICTRIDSDESILLLILTILLYLNVNAYY